MTQTPKTRISSIDILRGLVMLLMLVDHVRERFYYHLNVTDPMTLDETSTSLFFTRITAHFCAPVFVFLTGLSAWLYANSSGQKKSAHEFLIKRGLFIILVEVTLINLSWFGNYEVLYLQVMWAIGISMIALGCICSLRPWQVGIIGLVIVFGHNALEFINLRPGEVGYTLWTILHDRGYVFISESFKIKASYPVLPWIGIICLGYALAPVFARSVASAKRQKTLLITGSIFLLILCFLRGFNIYGETAPWTTGETWLETTKSIINFTKYPPSLDFTLFTLGLSLMVLSGLDRVDNRLTKIIENFGSAPLFFYVLHLYVLLLAYTAMVNVQGTTKGGYWGLDHVWQIWAVAAFLACILYWPTKWFARYKKQSSSTWIKYC